MRVIVLSDSPGADHLADQFVEATREFNRGLDIRLRFLDVGFELRSIPVTTAGPSPAPGLEEQLGTFRPGAVLLLGGSPRMLECAAVVAKAGPPIAFFTNGRADRASRAIAELSEILVQRTGESAAQGGSRSPTRMLPTDQATGPALVDLLVRIVRE
jgi:hypothetical protein